MLMAKAEEQTKARKKKILTTSILHYDELTPKTAVLEQRYFLFFFNWRIK